MIQIHKPLRTFGYSGRVRTGRHNRTMLTHNCWFFKRNQLKNLTVEQCIERCPDEFIWAYEHLAINWSEYVVKKMQLLYPGAKRFKNED
jgi:hypothetical protein